MMGNKIKIFTAMIFAISSMKSSDAQADEIRFSCTCSSMIFYDGEKGDCPSGTDYYTIYNKDSIKIESDEHHSGLYTKNIDEFNDDYIDLWKEYDATIHKTGKIYTDRIHIDRVYGVVKIQTSDDNMELAYTTTWKCKKFNSSDRAF